jgi:hypothetical protein
LITQKGHDNYNKTQHFNSNKLKPFNKIQKYKREEKNKEIDLNSFNLNIHFLSSLDSKLRGWLRRAILQITGSTQSSILSWNILRPNKSCDTTKGPR